MRNRWILLGALCWPLAALATEEDDLQRVLDAVNAFVCQRDTDCSRAAEQEQTAMAARYAEGAGPPGLTAVLRRFEGWPHHHDPSQGWLIDVGGRFPSAWAVPQISAAIASAPEMANPQLLSMLAKHGPAAAAAIEAAIPKTPVHYLGHVAWWRAEINTGDTLGFLDRFIATPGLPRRARFEARVARQLRRGPHWKNLVSYNLGAIVRQCLEEQPRAVLMIARAVTCADRETKWRDAYDGQVRGCLDPVRVYLGRQKGPVEAWYRAHDCFDAGAPPVGSFNLTCLTADQAAFHQPLEGAQLRAVRAALDEESPW